ncbi:MAG: hypothetical protein ACREQJ_00375 [Candidatus Binatia bacterium]
MTFEILPVDAKEPLPEDVREIEGARLQVDDFDAEGKRYLKMTIGLPLPSGDRRERVVFFHEDAGKLRMLGFHSIKRKVAGLEGETLVFDTGTPNPLRNEQSRVLHVPADSYSYLALTFALRGLAAAPKPIDASLWHGDERTEKVRVVGAGTEELELLGTKIVSLKLEVHGGTPDAVAAIYWYAATAPHSFLQYEGPADFVTAEATIPRIRLRATSSSDQRRKFFGG